MDLFMAFFAEGYSVSYFKPKVFMLGPWFDVVCIEFSALFSA